MMCLNAKPSVVCTLLAWAVAASAARLANAEPDAIIGSLLSLTHWTSAGPIDGLRAYSISRTICNLGSDELDWNVTPSPHHPVTAPNLYRLKDGRIEQIGQGWVMHHFCALQQNVCDGPCAPACGGCCSSLGPGCSTVNSSANTGSLGVLGPRSQINVHTGVNPGVYPQPQGDDTLRGRVLVRQTDLDPALNPGALYFGEVQIVAQDDAQAGDMTGGNNNASYRRLVVNTPSYFISPSGNTDREHAAIHAWAAQDNGVTIVNVDIPDEGRLILAYKATENGDGTWHYEYALHNLNSDRSAGSFSVPVPGDVTVTNVGFHDVDYHSGEPYSLDDWPATDADDQLTWATQPYDENENANALRWGTLYNFRFDADTPPQPADLTIGLFKPGVPQSVTVPAVGPAESCPTPALLPGAAGVSFTERAFDGFIDARRESSDGIHLDLGLDAFTLEFNTPLTNLDGGPLDATAFSITDTGGTAPSITGVSTEDGSVVMLALSGPITVGQWTTFSVLARAACGDNDILSESIRIGFLPADVDQSGSVTPFDLFQFRQYVSGIVAPAAGVLTDYVDTDRDGQLLPFDLLALRQLINGVPPATRVWAGQALPQNP